MARDSVRSSIIFLHSALPMRLMNAWNVSPAVALVEIAVGDAVHRFGDALGRHRADRQAVGAGVLLPLAAEHDLEVRHGVAVHVAADAVEAEVGDVVLAAGVEAAADLDVQAADGLVQLAASLGEPHAQLAGQAARGGDAQLAGVGARAGGDVDDGAGARRGQIRLPSARCRAPADRLRSPSAGRCSARRWCGWSPDVLARDVGQRAQLVGGDVAQRQRDGDVDVAGLALLVDVGLVPARRSLPGAPLPICSRSGGLSGVLVDSRAMSVR